MAKVSRDVFGFKHPKMPKEFWAFFVIAIIVCSVWKIFLAYLLAFVIISLIMALIKINIKDPNDPFSDWKK
jgi:hypothetical protein